MTTTPPSPESLAQARAELKSEGNLNGYPPGSGFESAILHERATVIELRRQLADECNAHSRTLEQWRAETKRWDETLATERQRAEAADRELSEWSNWFQQKDPAKAYDAIANEHDSIRSARDQWHRDYCQASEERSNYQGSLAASEAKRKALREAVEAFVDGWKDEDAADGNLDGPRIHNVDMLTKALAADSKDTPGT